VTAVSEGRVDLAFGRVHGMGKPLPANLLHQLVRWDPLGIVLPAGHPLAKRAQVPMSELAGHPLVLHTAEEATEWQNWNEELAAAFGLTFGWRLHGHGRGAANAAILTYQAPSFGPLEAPVPDGIVVRPVLAPVPLYRLSVFWRSGHTSAALRRTLTTIQEIAGEHGWLDLPQTDWWTPAIDRP
jgi:DNA-binding transcriptional LysR family regulator